MTGKQQHSTTSAFWNFSSLHSHIQVNVARSPQFPGRPINSVTFHRYKKYGSQSEFPAMLRASDDPTTRSSTTRGGPWALTTTVYQKCCGKISPGGATLYTLHSKWEQSTYPMFYLHNCKRDTTAKFIQKGVQKNSHRAS